MKQTRFIHAWHIVMLCLTAWLLPQRVAATHVDDTWKYQVSLNGSNTISIQAPVYDQEGADCWVCDGNLKATWTDDSGKTQTKTVFHWQRNGDTDSSSKDIWIWFRTDVGGSIDVTQGNTSNHFTLTSADGDIQRLVYRNNDGNTYTVYAVWRLPYDMLGKDGKSRSVKFTWDVQRDGNSRSKEKVSGLSDVTISVPAAQGVVNPQVTMASMAYSEVGKLEVPWFIASTSLTAARYEYINANGQKVQQQLPTNANSGTIYLDATEPHDNFRVVVSYKDNSNYSIDNVSSETQNLKMIHAPVGFTATPTGDSKASVRLAWSIQHPNADDLSEMDFFEVQRSLTGEEADFVTIGSEPFMLSAEELNYTYIDSTLIDAVTEAQLTGGGTLSKLTYRIRRMITQNWGWDGNNCAQQATCTVSNLHLLYILNSSARWEDERAYTVRVSWDYDNGPNAVWDNRADMKMRIVMRNRDGAVVDSTLYTLTADERQQRYKVVTLSRPCVDYDVVVYVDRGTSPLPSWDAPMPATDYFPIRTVADWNTFRQKVIDAKGLYDVCARLYADITTNASCGDKDYPFRGHFDGNGHTLTFSTSTGNSFEAPFKVAKDYTIENLTVNGVIKGGQHSAGLVGDSYSSVGRHNIIRNVRVSSTVESARPYIGGIVGHGNRAGHIIVNGLFDGTLKSTGSNAYGGAIIGWCDDNSENYVSNCFENGTYEGITNIGLYFLSIGGGNGSAYSNDKSQNNWSANQMNLFGFTSTIIINSEADWELFRQEVQAAKGQRSVDAIMNIDISVTSMVGDQDSPYCGTFNGNGHTLTVYINDDTGSMVAPFRWVGKSTFKNLRVNGDVKGGIHAAGLIGGTNNYPVRIENMYSSVRVSTSDSYVGGIIGHAHKSDVYIEDCMSFGSLFANGSNAYGGAVIGWSNPGGTWEMHRVYEWGNFYDITNQAFSYDYEGSSAHAWGYNDLSTTCVSFHGFSEVKPDYRNKSVRQAVSIFNNEQPGSWMTSIPYEPVMEVMSVSEESSLTFSDALLANLGSGWKKDGADVVPITLPTFHHESIGKVEKTLVTQTRQSSVVITWDTDGNPVDYFQVLRRVKGGTNWEVIADQLDYTSYEDKTVSPLSDYEYMVRGANDCEGLTYSETDIAQGACKHTGRVSGYVRLKDGTGVPGIEISLTPTLSQGEGAANTAVTDETGYFVADELSYFGKTSVTYTVSPVSSSAIQLEVESYAVTFDNRSNDETLREFVITNSHRFTGYVMYDGTSIPVKGAHFRVNGQPLHNNKGGYVETDFDGSFSFNVLDGKNVIQAVMDGHTFTGDGYFKGKDGHVFTDDVAQIYFYDDTKVKLTGRVVGGNDQGRLPLENNLSRNNLGDDLTMVFTLEGDNTSWLVYDNQNPERTERDTTFMHTGGQHSTQVQTQRKRMVVKPDAVTGEYVLMLPPVRWKVQQVYCKGYPTLFQDGQVSEVVDLTDCRDTVYSRIYHAPVEITYRQANYETFDYFGDKTYTASTVGGDKVTVPLVCEGDASNTAAYTFGYPVFSLGRKYPIELQVGERYLYNNDTRTGQVDIVSVGGGQVTVRNGMRNGLQQEVVTLDSLGQGRFYLLADQTTRLLTGEDALKTVTMTLTQDGTTYEAKPLQGYVLNMFATSGAKDVISAGEPVLIDVLRDPPGGSSTATLSKGSKLKLSYTVDMKFKAGLDITFGTGTSLNNYSGLVAGTAEYGLINSATTTNYIDLAVIFSGAGKKAYSYTMTVGEDITTSGAATMVGAEADLYIGVVQNMIVTPVSTIRAIPDSLYQHMKERLSGDALPTGNTVKYGTLVEIAKGQDTEGNVYHLVRDESLAYGPQLESQFIHSQKHIVSEILPKLANEINALLFTGTLAEAQAQANQTGQPVYLVTKTAEGSGLVEDYQQVLPAGSTGLTDEVAQKLKILKAWVDMIAMNEMEKLNAHDLVANYDVDGGTKVSYSEAFETEYSVSQYINYPFTQADFFGSDGVDGRDVTLAIANTLLSQPALASLFKLLSKAISPGGTSVGENPQQGKLGDESLELSFAGTKFNFGIKPVAEYSSTGTYGTQHNYSRKESFNLSMDPKSHLSVDVYRAHTLTTDDQSGDTGNFDVFRNDNFDDWVDAVNNHINDGVDYSQVIYPHNFVYRTRGGATHAPWEDARYTVAYQPGTPLDERTKKICNPVITLDRQSVSGVAMGEPARFKMYITNESEWPEAATGGLTMYTLFMDGEHNPNGAKLSVDGSPLDGNGMSIVLYPGKVLEKTLEVYAGSEFDYEGLVVGVASSSDWINTQCKVAFDVHYLHEAGPVLIASPGDKWVMNTNAQYDAERGWFLPVTIEGFDKHQPNFDHIEFQYKESLRGEDAWTNLCSYYADSLLMAEASGVKEMIPENGNITNRFYGEGTVMEKAYDLRAVLYCRNGNAFLTTASPIVSGVKDTRRPQLFGTPEPINGILTMGQNIVFNFSENIEYNYLNAVTNFEVKGEVNNQNVTETVSLQFSGNSSVESEAQRNFSGKDLTIDLMIRPDETGRDMPLFSHGTNGKRLQLWLTSDYRLKAVVDDQEFTSTDTIEKGGFTQVAMSIEAKATTSSLAGDLESPTATLTFYNGGKSIGSFTLTEPYNGTGALIFGRTNEADRTQSTFYNGRMMEARLWYRALDGGQVGTTYGSRRLTGYEMGLVDYYPMNEGTGDYAIDQTQGANARLINASWAMPRGLSLHVDWDDKGIALTQNALNRTSEQDYTLMFWFKTDAEGRGVLLSNGAGSNTEINAENQFNIAFEAEKLMYRSNGHAYDLGSTYSDNQWHHLAMTVNRAYNVANIYVDQALKATFSPDSLGGISGGHPMIGGAKYDELDADGHLATIDTRNWLRGNVDELMFFSQALPLQLIKTYATKSPNGDEAGLLTYLSFDRQERQKDNDIVLVAYPYSKKIYLDNNGNPRYELEPETQEPTSTPVRDYVFVGLPDEILAHITDETAAPVVPYEELKNLTFSFVGKDNQLLVGINEPEARINRRNIYVTVRDVEDKNGNAMASPQTACYYVTNSALSWLGNREAVTVWYGQDNTDINLLICNNGATSHTYAIENCPRWLTLSTYTDVIAPQEYVTIAARVSKDLNVGSYDEILYLTDENGISEPFYLNLTVEGEQPDWTWSVSSDLLQYSMNIVGRVFVNDEIDIDNRDIVGVFGQDGQCHGFAHVSYSVLTGESNLYLTAYDNQASGRDLYFKLWQYATGRELQLTANGGSTLTFQNNTVIGTDTPVRFEGGNLYVQTFDLKEGWNWVSFNVASERLFNLNNLLDGLPWKDGDVLTDMNSDVTLVYTAGHWLASENPRNIVLSPRKAYAIKVQEDIKFPVAGSLIKADDARTIMLQQGWNGIGYTPMLNLPIETALSDYYDKAEPGDVIKSHTEFAYFTVSGGVGRWRGSLEYMKPGEGYMLLRKGTTTASFRYPFYEPGSTFIDAWSYSTSRSAAPAHARSTMTVSATVEGIELQEGDRLVAYANGEAVGTAVVLSGTPAEPAEPLYLSIAGDKQQGIWFAIERQRVGDGTSGMRDDEIIASTSEQMTFTANAVIGSPDEPTVIRFIRNDYENGRWYTTSGVRLPSRPTYKGVYIYNGKKVVIK